MKKTAFILAFLILLIIPISANATSQRSVGILPNLKFDNMTANCVVSVTANSMSETIDITVKLWKGNSCLATWTECGNGVLYFSETKSVSSKGEYKLTVDAKIGGKAQGPVSVTNICG